MLDDLKYIHEKDGQDALGIAEKQWQQYQNNFNFNWQPSKEVHSVSVAGMGGSGLAAKVIRSWPSLSVSLDIIQDYDWPDEITENTLLICTSYSGNTEETLAILRHALDNDFAKELRPMVVVIASGGRLAEMATENNLPLIKLPAGYQPRMTLGYQLRALVEILEQAHLVGGASDQLTKTSDWLKDQTATWLPTVPAAKNLAKQIAQELMGKSVVIYSSYKFFPVAYKWKISFNENAKHIAWCNFLPEANHNEILGWTEQPVEKPYAVIDIRSSLDHPRIKKRFEVTERLLSGKRPNPIVIDPKGETLLEQILWTVTLGDFVSLYLAILNGLNPTPVEIIEKLKKAMNE